MLRDLLTHPRMRGRDLDHPATTGLKRALVRDKRFLRKIYDEWYVMIAEALRRGDAPVLELGSGPGFLGERIPGLITSEIFFVPGVRVVLDGCALPFADDSLRGIVMTDVFHHLPDARRFMSEASRCVGVGGSVVMVEPWVTPWSRMIYANLHHEPFMPEAAEWDVPSSGPLSGANGALPWIVFERDRARFEAEFPRWRIRAIEPFMPFRYLLSGGVSLRSLMPGIAFGAWRAVERALRPWMKHLAMFAFIALDRTR